MFHAFCAYACTAGLILSGLPLNAATFYWDTDGSTAGDNIDGTGLGGSGTWDTSTSNWWNQTSLVPWPNLNTDLAVFSGPFPTLGIPTTNTVTLNSGIIANGLSFARSGYTLTGGDLTLAGISPTLNIAFAESATIASLIQGSDGLTLTGGGAIRLSNALNSYTGTTTISRGSLIVASSGALGTDTSEIIVGGSQSRGFGGGNLVLEGGYSSGVTISRNISLQGLGVIADRSAALNSVGNNTLSGTITTSVPLNGTAQNTAINSAGGRLTLSGTLNFGTAATTFGVVNSTGVGSYLLSGTLTGSGTLAKTGGGTLLLSPGDASGYTGIFQSSAGSIRVTSDTAFGASTASNTIDLNGGIFEFRTDSPNFSTRKVNLNNGGTLDLFVDHGTSGSAIGQTVTFANFDYDVSETATISGRNGYNITFTAATAIGNGAGDTGVTYNGNGTLTFGGTLWGNSNTTARTLTINGSGNTVFSGNITATNANHNFTKSGTGTVTLLGTAGTFLGTTSVSAGTLVITDFRSINNNTAGITLGNATTTGGTLTIGTATAATAAGLTTSKVITINGTTASSTINASQSGANPVIINANFLVPLGSAAQAKTLTLGGSNTADNIINGIIPNNAAGGAVNITKADVGTWVLAGSNTYSGPTTITGGTLKLKASAAASDIIKSAATNTVVFDAGTAMAGGTLLFTGVSGVSTTESLGPLTLTAGAATVQVVSGGSSAAANLAFSSLAAITAGAGTAANFVTTGGGTGATITLTGVATTTATTIPGNGHLFFNGADFAVSTAGVLGAPTYTAAGAIFTTAPTALTASKHNLVTGDITGQGAVSVTSLKLTTNTLALTGVLAIDSGASGNDGGLLQSGGTTAAISGTGITTGAAGTSTLVIRVNGSGDVLTLSAPMTATGTMGFTKVGAGKLVLSGTNAQTGANSILEGTVQLSGSGVLSANSGSLVIRQAGTLDLNGLTTGTGGTTSSIGAFNGAGTVTNTNATAATLVVGGGNGAGTFAGIIQDGVGIVNVTKNGTGGSTWSGLSTYTGVTTIGSTGVVSVATLANYGTASSIGRGIQTSVSDANNAASLVFSGSTGGIAYIGTTSVVIDRLFTLSGTGATISNNSANNSAMSFNKTNALTFGIVGPQLLTLGGSSTGDSRINLQITNSGTGANITSISKIGGGLWILGNSSNSYTGTTSIIGTGATATTPGYLQAIDGASLPTASGLILGGTTTGGVFQSTGNFTRNLVVSGSAASNTISWAAGLTTGASGFAASDGKFVIAIGGLVSPTALTWNSGGFMGTAGTTLQLNSPTALGEVEFRNPINLAGANRTIFVDDNTSTLTDFATITGVISTSGTGGIVKSGTGTLQLLGANTYNGTTSVTAGLLVVNSLGLSTGATVGTSVGTSSGANLSTQAITLGNATTTGASLQYVGAGETSDRMIRLNTTTATNLIYADGSGPLVLTNVLNNMTGGAKTLTLRGSNTVGNMITSVLADNGGALSITVDGGATWILSNINNYTGTTSVNAGALGIGNDNALGSGTLSLSNSTVFAYGADRTVSNAVSHATNTTEAFIGDYSITFSNTYALANDANPIGTVNNIVSGKTLTMSNVTANLLTAARTWTISGAGDTVVTGNITTGTAFDLNVTYSGTGSLTLGGTSSNWNAGLVTISSGTLKLSNNEVIPDGVGKGGVTLAPATGVTATLNLNGKTETINGLTANSAGNIVIDNTSASAASLIFGANDQAVLIGGGGGTYTISNSGGGPLSITKTGTATLTIPSGVTLTYTGATSVTGGTMTIASPQNGTIALSSTGNGNLNLTGGLTTPGAITSVTVGGGSFLSLLDGVGSSLSNLSVLDLGAGSGIATLSLELGATSDTLTTSTAATIANTIRFNLNGVSGLLDATEYALLVAPSGLSAGTYTLGSQPGGFSAGFLTVSDNLVKYTTGSAIVGNLYWNNTQTNNSWAFNNAGLTNFTTDLAGTTDGTFTPGPGTTVIFGTTALTGGPTFTTTLDANFTIAGLQFTSNPTGVTSWTINAGTPSTSNLTINAGGISVASNAGAVTINPPIALNAGQSWMVDGTGANGSSLTVNGIVSGPGALTKTGSGTLTMSGANTFSGGLTVRAASVIALTSNRALGGTAGAGIVTIGDTSGATAVSVLVGTTGLNYANPFVLAAGGSGTLTIGNANDIAAVTFSGGVTGTNNLTINNDSATAGARTITFSTAAVNNAGTITNIGTSTGTTTISGGIGSNVTQIIENSTTSALTVSTTALNVNASGTTLQNLSGTKLLTVSAAVQGTGNLILKNDSTTTGGVTVGTGSVNFTGQIINNGVGVNSTSGVIISGIIGTNVLGVVQDSANSSMQLTGANLFTSGITIKKGILEGATSGSAFGADGNIITLGDTSGSSDASLRLQSNVNYGNTPVNVAAGSSGTLSILGSRTTGTNTFSGAITLANNLVIGAGDAGATTANPTFTGGITGTGNLAITYSATALTGAVTFSTNPLDFTGTIINNGNTTGTTTISGGIGSNVTQIIENSTTSALTISTTALNVNASGTTLQNLSGTKLLTVSAAVQGTGNLILKNDSATANGVTLGTGSVNFSGQIINNGVGVNATNGVLVSGIIGTNVLGVVQDSTTSAMVLSGANVFTSGITIKKGILEALTSASALGADGNVITLGDTSGSNNASLRFHTSNTYANTPINVVAGSSGTLSILGSRTTGATVIPGAITLANNLVIGAGDAGATTAATTFTGGITGAGNLAITYSATALTGAVTFSTNPLNFTGTITNNGNTTGTTVISANILTNVGLITQNSSTSALTLSGANTFTGGVSLALGTLNINSASALGSGGTLSIAGGTTINNSSAGAVVNSNVNPLTLNGDFTFTGTQSLDLGTGAASLGPAAGTSRQITATANTLTLGGAISNGTTANSITKAGAGTLLLSGASTFSGPVTINAGTLSFTTVTNIGGAASSLGQGSSISMAGGVLSFVGATNQATDRPITLTAAATLDASGTLGATMTFNGAITGASTTLTLGGTGFGVLNGLLTQTGTTADLSKTGSGTWRIDTAQTGIADDIIVTSGMLILNSAAAHDGDDLFIRAATLRLDVNGALTNTMDVLNVSTETAGGGILDINGTTGSAPTTIALGVVNLSGSIIDSVGTGSIGGAFAFRNGTVTAALTGSGAMTKTTTATVTLGNSSPGYTGAATVTEGLFVLDYTTNNGEKLSNSGAGALTLNGGATVVFNGNAGTATLESLGGLTVAAASALVDVNNGSGQSFTLNLGALTRTALSKGGTLRLELPAIGSVTTTTANRFGILGGYFTAKNSAGVVGFAVNDGTGNIVIVTNSAQDDVSLWPLGGNVTDSTGYTGSKLLNSIGSLSFNADAASTVTVQPGGILNVASGGIYMSSAVLSGSHLITGGTLTSSIGELIFTQDSTSQGLTVASAIIGNAGVTKAGAGTLTLSGINNYVNQTDIQAGILIAVGGNAVGDNSAVSLALELATTFQITANETIGALTGGSTTNLVGAVAIGSNTLTVRSGGTYAGVFTGNGTIVKNSTLSGTNWNLTGSTTTGFTGAVIVDGGLFQLSGSTGTLSSATSFTINKGGALLIDNNDAASPASRISDSAGLFLNSADGTFSGQTVVRGLSIRTSDSATHNETIGVLTYASGANYFAGEASGTTGIASILANNFVRTNNATVDARGRALGLTTGDRNALRISDATNQTAFIGTGDNANLVGGSGAAATKTISIVPWAIGESTTAALTDVNMGNSLVTYVSGAGFRPLDFTTEYNTFATRAGNTDNIRESVTADLTGLSGTTINALVLNNNNTTVTTPVNITGTGAGQSLAIRSGAILFTLNTGATASTGYNIVLGGFDSGISMGGSGITDEYVIHVVNPSSAANTALLTATIASNLTSTADLTKSGRGTLILTGSNTAGGGTKKTTLNEGTLEIADLDNIGGSTGSVVFAGGTLRFGLGFADDLSSRTVNILSGGATIDTNGANFVFANSIGGGGGGGLIKTGVGSLTFMSSATYTGATAVVNGSLILAGGGNNRLSTAAALVLGSGANSGIMQLGTAAGISDQTVGELSTSGSGTSNAIVGGNASASTFTVNQNTTTTYAGGIGGVGTNENNLNFVKSGVGTLTLSGATLSYTGQTTVSAGTLNITGSAGSALATTGITVAAAATLNFLNTAGQSINLGSGTLDLGSGSGATVLGLELGATGAYDSINTSGVAVTSNTVLFDLTGISGFTSGTYDLLTAGGGLGGATYGIRSFGGSMAGVTLNLTSSSTFVRLNATASTGDIYWSGGVNASWIGNSGTTTNFTTNLAGTINANGTPGVASNVIFSAQNAVGPVVSTTLDTPFSIGKLLFTSNPSGVTSVTIAAGTPSTNSLTITPTVATDGIDVAANAGTVVISAPVILGANQTWSVDGTGVSSLSVSGGITGTANLIKAAAGTLTLSGTNTYVGTTTVSGGVLQAGGTNGLNATSSHAIAGGTFLRLNNFDAAVGSLTGSGTVENSGAAAHTLTLGGDNTSTTFGGTLQNGGAGTLGLFKVGAGLFTLSGTNTYTGTTTVNAGVLEISGNTNTGAGATTVSSTAGTRGRMLFSTGASFTSTDIDIGSNATAAGAALQSAGSVTISGADATNRFTLGNAASGYGYYRLAGGTLTSARLTVAGNTFTGATGIFDQTGGSVTLATWAVISQGAGNSLVDVSGGDFNVGTNFALNLAANAYSVVNVRGTGTITKTGSTLISLMQGNASSTGNVGVLNVNSGGTLVISAAGVSNGNGTGSSGNVALLNFNGGTLKTGAASTVVFNISGAALTASSGAYAYSGGATIDTNGFDSTLTGSLRAPTGEGVQSIAVSNGGSGYLSAPLIKISGGSGVGATAVANMVDDGTGNNTFSIGSITITSPGTGYVNTDVLTLSFGDNAGLYTAQAVLGAVAFNGGNVSGGLTKTGVGKLTLSGANTYTGTTLVNVGTIALGAANVLADASSLDVAGGTFDAATFSDTVGAVTLTSGTLTGSTGVLTSTVGFDVRSGVVNFTGAGGLAGSVGLTKSTAGTVTLSSANAFTGAVNVNGGVLSFGASGQLGNAGATNTIGINGGTLSYSGAGATDLSANRVLTIGASGGTVDVSNSVGSLTISGGISASSTGNFTKTGPGTLIVSGSTSLNSGAGSVTVGDGTFRGGFGTGGIAVLSVGSTGVMDFRNGAAQILTLGSTGNVLTLSSGARLAFELDGTSNDGLVVPSGGAALLSGGFTFDFFNLNAGVTNNIYTLLTAPTGSNLSGFTYTLGVAPNGFNYTILTSDTQVQLQATPYTPIYWRGGQDLSWNTLGASPANWTSDASGIVDSAHTPLSTETVIFSALGAPTVTNTITTTLDAAFTIDSLQFTNVPAGITSVTINPGSGGSLNITPLSASGGIRIFAGGGNAAITAPLTVGAAQTWDIDSTGSLSIGGNTTFSFAVNKTGGGVLTLSGSNSGTGAITLSGGTLNVNSNTALGAGTFTIGAGTIVNSTVAGISLANNNVQNWSGDFTFTGSNSLNFGTGAVTLGASLIATISAQTLTVGGNIGDGGNTRSLTKLGGGTLVLSGNNTYDGLTTLSAGTLTLNGNNSGAAGGLTMAASTVLNLGNASALGTGAFTVNGGTFDNTSGGAMTLAANNALNFNGSFTFTGSSNLDLGTSTASLGSSLTITVSANRLTVGAVNDGGNVRGLTKDGAGILELGGTSVYGGATIINAGTLKFSTGTQSLAATTNLLTFGTAAGSTAVGSLDLSTSNATFGGAFLVQTNSASANTITIGSGQTLRVNAVSTIGYNSAGNSTTKLTITGAGSFTIGALGSPTNAGFSLGAGTTTNISNAGTLDMSGLTTFYANLGTGTFRIGSPTNSGGTAAAGSTIILAANSTITATTLTTDSPDSGVTQAIKLGSNHNFLNANTIDIGPSAGGRSTGTLDFNTTTGDVQIRNLATTGRAAMNVQNGASGTSVALTGTVNLTAHSADLLLSTLSIGGRSAGTTGGGTGTFSFDTGNLDATTVVLAARSGSTLTTGAISGTMNLMQAVGTTGAVTIGTLNMAINSATTATTNGRALAALNIGGAGTVNITTMTMANNSITGGATNQTNSPVNSTVTVTGSTTTIGTLNMNLNSSTNTGTNNASLSALNISAGTVNIGAGGIDMANVSVATATATSSISITGSGVLSLAGNLSYTQGVGTENTTLTLDGVSAVLNMGGFSIGSATSIVGSGTGALSFRAGILRNVNEINGGGASASATLNKTTAGTLLLDTANGYTGFTTVSAGVLQITNGNALGGVARGTTVSGTGAALEISNSITTSAEGLTLNGAGIGGGGALRNTSGNNTYTGAVTLGSDSRINSDGGLLTIDVASGNALSGDFNVTFGGAGNITVADAVATGVGALNKDGGGTLTLAAANTYTGITTISGGTLSVGTLANGGTASGIGQASNATSNLVFSGGGTLQYTGGSVTTNRGFTVTGGNTGVIEVTNAATRLTLSGDSAATSGNLQKTGSGSLTLNGTYAHTGTTTVSAGTLNGTGTLSSQLVVQSGATYSAGTSVNGTNNDGVGKMSIASGDWQSGASFVFDFGQTSTGSAGDNGTNWDLIQITGAGGQTLTLGSGTGIYTLNVTSWDLSATPVPGANNGANNFDKDAPATITPGEPSPYPVSYRWLWVDNTAAGTINVSDGVLDQFNVVASPGVFTPGPYGAPNLTGGHFWVSSFNNDLYINYSSVPEPGSLLLVGLAGLGFAGYRRRKRRAAHAAESATLLTEDVVAAEFAEDASNHQE